MLLAVFFFVVSALGLLLSGTLPLVREIGIVRDLSSSRDAYYWAEGAVEDVAYRIKKGYGAGSSETVPVDGTAVAVSVTDVPGSRIISALGDKNGDQRRVQATVVAGTGVNFSYGIQVGSLGISLGSGSSVSGSVFTNGSITGSNGSSVSGSAIAVGSISSPDPSVTGTRQSGAPSQTLPEVDVNYWKTEANKNSDPYNGNMSFSGTGNTLGPRKIVGNLTINNNATLTITGPVYVTGNLTLSNGATLALDQGFGSNGTMIVVGGNIFIQNNSFVTGTTATPKGYLLLLSEASGDAIQISNNANADAYFYAYNGTVVLANNSSAHTLALVGQGFTLSNNANLTFELGISHPQFSSGPGGTFDIKSWKETE